MLRGLLLGYWMVLQRCGHQVSIVQETRVFRLNPVIYVSLLRPLLKLAICLAGKIVA